ncbi:MAG: hypothetical protein WC729_07905 [Sphingomonas sp.]|jgi:ElaB/YqjD/DUF883 family membrane-anchored ribosome-binding protein|uniref:hypothetical protein n=1 Tax=Sphingomonas sp. TaxID=28214 RepID=UPI00356B4DA5
MNAPTTDKPATAKPTPRTAAERALDTTRDTAREAVRRTAQGIEANPLAVLVGGVAIGVLAGAVIPRTEQEGKLLGPVGKRLTDTAAGAAQAAKEAGKAELDALGLNKDAARDQVGKLLDGVVKALSSAGSAAAAKASSK